MNKKENFWNFNDATKNYVSLVLNWNTPVLYSTKTWEIILEVSDNII